jgi:hypothetical protein
MATSPPRRRRPPKIDTERMEAIRSCSRHLKDLQRAHKRPPVDVEVNTRGVPKFVPPIIEQSYCTSPAALCAELAEPIKPRAELAEPVEAADLWAELAELVEAAELCAELMEPIDAAALIAELEEESAQ